MGIIRLTLITVAAIGGAMSYFGRDENLPIDRIGREPSIAQETIETVSAPAVAQTATPATSTTMVTASFAAVPTTQDNTAPPETAAEEAEAAARKMANRIATSAPAAIAPTKDQQTAFVSGSAVNMRAGPSTKHGIVARLTRGTEVIDLGSAGEGWNQIKVVDTGTRGFMATRFLAPTL